ncbi:hypothetical protein SFRURICE_007540 [Spodoptera frugiperda]|nr:hypothetical protein SFRURICE_007540 [Spodoptera frugiperda]
MVRSEEDWDAVSWLRSMLAKEEAGRVRERTSLRSSCRETLRASEIMRRSPATVSAGLA